MKINFNLKLTTTKTSLASYYIGGLVATVIGAAINSVVGFANERVMNFIGQGPYDARNTYIKEEPANE